MYNTENLKPLPFRGGVNTDTESTTLPTGAFSVKQNIRDRHPGFAPRKGQIRLHSTVDVVQGIKTLYQYIDKANVRHTYAQRLDGSVHRATNNPPEVTTGDFGTEVLGVPITTATHPSSMTVVAGYHASGVVGDLGAISQSYVEIYEANNASRTNGIKFDVEFDFTGIHTICECIHFQGRYEGNPAHQVEVYMWNYSTETWNDVDENTKDILSGSTDNFIVWQIPGDLENYFSGTAPNMTARVRIYHPSSANKNHTLYIDMIGLGLMEGGIHSTNASWSEIGNNLIFSDGGRQHQIYSGTEQMIKAFIVYKSASASTMPVIGEDYTDEVTDDRTSRVGVLDNVGTNGTDRAYIATDTSATGFTWEVYLANSSASSPIIYYWNGAWTSAGSIIDTTSISGQTLAQDGTMSWTRPSDEIPYYQYGLSAYWYQVAFSGALDSVVEVNEVTYESEWQDIVNMWDGVMIDAIEAQVHDQDNDKYLLYGGAAIDISDRFEDGDDRVYFSSVDKLFGVHMDMTNTPHIAYAKLQGDSDINFVLVSGGDSYIESETGVFYERSFEPGMDITVTSTTNNNHTWTIKRMSASKLYVEGSDAVEDESDQSALIVFDDTTPSIDTFEVWTGDDWTSVTNLVEGTVGLTKTGYVMFDRTTTAQKTQFNQSGYYAYWYRFKVDKAMSNNVILAIRCMSFFDISSFGNSQSSTVWKDRVSYSFDKWGNYIYLCDIDRPQVLNGDGYGILRAGDGRRHKVLAQARFHNELIVWQEEKGVEGGTVTLFEGYSPTTFGKLLLDDRIGIVNAKSIAVLSGIEIGTKTDIKRQTTAFWISRYGVFLTNGLNFWKISDLSEQNGSSIQNYFDPTRDECIRKGYESSHWLAHDEANHILRLGLVSGSSAIVPNIFPIFDYKDFTWSFDTKGQALTCLQNLSAHTGEVEVVQIAGGIDGFMYLLNTGTNDVGASTVPIDTKVTMEIDGLGDDVSLNRLILRCKTQDSGDITQTMKFAGHSSDGDSSDLTMVAKILGDSYRRHMYLVNAQPVDTDHVSITWENNEESEEMYLLDLKADIGNKNEPRR